MASGNQQKCSRFNWFRRWVTRKSPQLRPRVFPKSGFETIDPSQRIEEECMSIYKPELFYPVRLGQVFQNRYQVVAKLGFGSSATIWLGHDLQDCIYVCLKIQINTVPNNHEVRVYEHLEKHRYFLGSIHIRPLERSFKIRGPHGSHDVLVQAPLAIAITDFQDRIPKGVFPSTVVKEALKQMVPALDFLHSDAHVIHTDFHPGNLLIGFEDRDECLAQVEEGELKNPGPRKVLKDRTIYRSRVVIGNIGPLYLCDFGNAHIGEEGSGIAMSISFRAPEVILGMKWSYPIDMWSVGVSAWDMLQSKKLFEIYDVNDQRLNNAHHLANMIALLGPPPLDYLKRSETYLEFWDERGNWRGIVPIPQERTLESLEGSLQGDDRTRFLDFTRALLCWAPEKRLTAKRTLLHTWLTTPYE
ncbi:kinase-like protein [Nemania sp. FL0031]|nr:kinase-like protein [Nemania sp. FL0031]